MNQFINQFIDRYVMCRFANWGLDYQEKAVLMKKAEDAKARGEAPPDEPGMQQILAEMKTASSVSELPSDYHVSKAESAKTI